MAIVSPRPVPGALDVESIRRDFPIFANHASGPFHFLDSAASSQKPSAVLDAMTWYYEHTHANVHRGVYAIAEEATRRYEDTRRTVANFVGAASTREIVYTKNATEALNVVAKSWGRTNLDAGDPILLTQLEHHANLVPWLQLADEVGIELRYLPVDSDGRLDLSNLDALLDGVKLVAVSAASNVLGTLPPVRQIADAAHAEGALVVVDGSQFSPHRVTDVTAMGADFYAFTGHKLLGPTGIGVLWGREALLDAMPPFLGGGDMILDVRLDGFTPNELPWKFEAGTPPIAEAIGLAAAIDALGRYDIESVAAHEIALTAYALGSLRERFTPEQLTIHGPCNVVDRGGVISFTLADVHPHDISQVLDEHGVCVRAGHHCAKPLMRILGVPATARASFYLYNDEADVDALVDALAAAADFFAF